MEFAWQDKRQEADRPDCFHYDPWCLHLSKGVKGRVTALDHAEIYLQMTYNPKDFESRLYGPPGYHGAARGG